MIQSPLPFCLVVSSFLTGAAGTGSALSTAFTYQGRLTDKGAPASGLYDLSFGLFDAESGGIQIGNTLTGNGVSVTKGLFVLSLDFGAAPFNGADRWLEIGVRTNGSSGGFTPLTPRQPISAAPYSVNALTAAVAQNLGGMLPDSKLSANIPRLDGDAVFTGSLQAASFVGDGSRLTGVVGTRGPAGPQGPPGATGPQSPQGATGLQGATGATGPQGATGLQGSAGPQGPQGDTGSQGPQGPQGAKGLNWKAAWSAVDNYLTDDAVSYNGSAWLAKRANSNVTPVERLEESRVGEEGRSRW